MAYEGFPFTLLDSTGHAFDDSLFLCDLGLVPAAVLNFQWDEDVVRQISVPDTDTRPHPSQQVDYLSKEFLHSLSLTHVQGAEWCPSAQ